MDKEVKPDNSDEIKGIIAENLRINQADVLDDQTMSDLNADSLDGIELLLELEDGFNIDIPDAEFESLKTVGEIVEYVNKKIGDKK